MMFRDEKLEIYLENLNKLFPEISLHSSFSIYNGENPISGNIILANVSDAFKNAFNLNKQTTILHYTSIENMLTILDSQSFRLYNCLNLNDSREIEFANDKFDIGFSINEIESLKRNYFVGAFCNYDLEKGNDDFNLWRLYGRNGNGAALVFEIENMDHSWENFFIGNVCYDDQNVVAKRFKEFILFHQEFQRDYNLFENTPYILSAIGLHFKDEIWKIENEIRLFTSCPFDNYTFEIDVFGNQNSYLSNTISHTVNNIGEFVSYISLPLNIKKAINDLQIKGLPLEYAHDHISAIPHLKLKKIILGYNVSSNIFLNVKKVIDFHKYKKVFEDVQLEISLLKRKFMNN